MNFLTSLISPQFVSLFFFLLSVFILMLWWSTVFWAYQDIKNRTKSQLLFTISMLTVICLPIIGVMFYFFIRPTSTMEERQFADLEKLAFLKEIKDNPNCPFCEFNIEKNFVACPNCHRKIKNICQKCGEIIELDWTLCPYCASRQIIKEKENEPKEKTIKKLNY